MEDKNKKSLETAEEAVEKGRLLFEQPVELKKVPEGVEIKKVAPGSKTWPIFTFIAFLALGAGLIVIGNSYLSNPECEQYRDPHDPIGCALKVIGGGFSVTPGVPAGGIRRCTYGGYSNTYDCTECSETPKITESDRGDLGVCTGRSAGGARCILSCSR